METKIAISQKPPVLLDLEATYFRAIETIAEAARKGAKLIVFPYLPGYPTWLAAAPREGRPPGRKAPPKRGSSLQSWIAYYGTDRKHPVLAELAESRRVPSKMGRARWSHGVLLSDGRRCC